MRRLPFASRRATSAVLAGGLCLVASACRDDDGAGDGTRFCEQVEQNVDALRANPQTPDDVDALIDLWRDVGADAPLAIEPDWQAHILLFETALEEEDMEAVFARIYATERSSVAVATWIQANCGFDWGPVATIVPQTTTTVPDTTTPT